VKAHWAKKKGENEGKNRSDAGEKKKGGTWESVDTLPSAVNRGQPKV